MRLAARPQLPLVRAAAAFALIAAAVAQAPAQEGEADAAGSGAAAQADASAVLVSGPERRRDLPFLPPNTIENHRGVYELTGASASEAPPEAAEAPQEAPEAAEARVEVFYTEEAVFRDSTWTETSCDDRAVHVLPRAGGTLIHYAWPEEQRHVFFRFGRPGAGAAADGEDDGAAAADAAAAAVADSHCDFIEAFLSRFSFFLETTDSGGAVPFPAVLPR